MQINFVLCCVICFRLLSNWQVTICLLRKAGVADQDMAKMCGADIVDKLASVDVEIFL